MTWKQAFTSSIGQKVIMSLSGIFLILFLIVHVCLNACIWSATGSNSDHGKMFNVVANFMGANAVPRVLEVGLFLLFIVHIVQGFVLAGANTTHRDVPYAINYGTRGSTWYSRSMGLLGTIVLLFLIIHISQFWTPSRFGTLKDFILSDGKHVNDLFGLMQTTFQHLWVVIIYVAGCISLGYHLAHGFQSAFRTLGVNNKRYQIMLRNMGYAFSIVVCFAFAMMPVSFYFGWVN